MVTQLHLNLKEPETKQEYVECWIREQISKNGCVHNWEIENYFCNNTVIIKGELRKIMGGSGTRYARWMCENEGEICHPEGNPHTYIFREIVK